MTTGYYIGVDLGGTKILTGIYDGEFQQLARVKTPTHSGEGGEAVFARIVTAIDSLIEEAKIDPALIKGMGLAVPGQVVPNSKTVRYAPNLNWRDFDLTPLIPAKWTWPIFIDNDVRMGTYGEWRRGVAQGAKNVFGIFAGTGVGGGLILDGKLFHGFNGHAGEIGHIVVHWRKGTTLEGIAGRRSMMKRAELQLGDAPKGSRKNWKGLDLATVKSSQLADLYQKHDSIAEPIIDDAARTIAAGIASVINLISPEVVVLGGGVAMALGENFSERIWELTLKMTLPRAAENVRFVTAQLGDDAGVIGAAAFALDQLAPQANH